MSKVGPRASPKVGFDEYIPRALIQVAPRASTNVAPRALTQVAPRAARKVAPGAQQLLRRTGGLELAESGAAIRKEDEVGHNGTSAASSPEVAGGEGAPQQTSIQLADIE